MIACQKWLYIKKAALKAAFLSYPHICAILMHLAHKRELPAGVK
jgi:hypothetical protein